MPDEHPIFYVSQHREDGAFSAKEEPNTAAQEHIPLCIDQDRGDSSAGTAGHYMGGFYFS